MTDNGVDARPWLRALLILFSFLGYVASALLNGKLQRGSHAPIAAVRTRRFRVTFGE
jgi:hypothetical protein